MNYRPVPLDYDETKGPAPDFCVVAVVDGKAAWVIHKKDTQAGAVLMVPDYETFITMFDENVTMVKHPPVKPGTPWDGEKFLEEDKTGFVEIGRI